MEEGSPACDPVVAYNDLMLQIDNEIVTVYRFVADICAAKFPELHSLTRVVKTIANLTVGSLWRICPRCCPARRFFGHLLHINRQEWSSSTIMTTTCVPRRRR
ncbi:hypothetical protein PI125_g11389 [Phytophthora idaei]|nr:hypothetical protein PI125_g11389 [Phytophthora idaei]